MHLSKSSQSNIRLMYAPLARDRRLALASRVSRRLIARLSAVTLIATGCAMTASTIDCHVTEEQFVKQLSTMNDWPTIYSVFKRNLPSCPDDGFFAEGYSEVIVRTLARRWDSLRVLNELVARDPAFRRFIYRHIDATTDTTELENALKNARTNCPPPCAQLCTDLAARAKSALARKP